MNVSNNDQIKPRHHHQNSLRRAPPRREIQGLSIPPPKIFHRASYPILYNILIYNNLHF